MRIRGLGRLKSHWARLKGRLAPGPMILLYHRVARLQQDPHLLAVSPEKFEAHLIAMKKHFRVVGLSELVEGLANARSLGPAVILTFDDGYADNAEIAFPLLKKHGIPATFYLTAGYVGTSREFFQDDFERLLLLAPDFPEKLQVIIDGKTFVWNTGPQNSRGKDPVNYAAWNITSTADPTPRHQAYREINGLLRAISPPERNRVLEQLRSQCGDPGAARSTHSAMTWEQARSMAACELVELGAHTVNHPWLSALSLTEQRLEIQESKQIIEREICRPVNSFAYPYGTRQSYTPETIGILNESGFANACSNFRERIEGRTDPYQLPRFVVRNWDGDEFLRQLSRERL